MQGGQSLQLNGVSATASNSGIHTSILKHAPLLRKADQDKLSVMSTAHSQFLGQVRPKIMRDTSLTASIMEESSFGLAKTVSLKCIRHTSCVRSIYKDMLCKKHFLDYLKVSLRSLFKTTYRDPGRAYSSVDPDGKGFITREDFLTCPVIKRLCVKSVNLQDVQDLISRENMFKVPSTGTQKKQSPQRYWETPQMDFDDFRRIFFPQYFQVEQDDGERSDHEISPAKTNHQKSERPPAETHESITQRLYRLEQLIKDKFANNWVSVRKAFLDLDSDYDGYVTVDDILRFFGSEDKDLDFKDLTKLIIDKDHKKQGKINYTDFSKWMGGEIQKSEGFYFRHDSQRNPQYEKNIKLITQRYEQVNKRVFDDQISQMNLVQTVLEKIKFQWKTLKKAFSDLNQEKSGAIKPSELRHYLNHWGLFVTEDQFKKIFSHFDQDKDGKISYEDFQNTAGKEINPMEYLYFRQDINKAGKKTSCAHDHCWNQPVGFSSYCVVHLKMARERGTQVLAQIADKVGDWQRFVTRISQEVERDDQNLIEAAKFFAILQEFGVTVNDQDKETLLQSFISSPDLVNHPLLNISRLYSIRLATQLRRAYDRVDMYEEADNPNLVDISGYFGLFYREKKQLTPISEGEVLDIISKDNKLVPIMKVIKDIDIDNNGYVTNQELDDIFKMHYEQELGGRELKPVFKKFASIQNRILIDYKRMKEYLTRKVQELAVVDQEIKRYMEVAESVVQGSRAGSQVDRISTASILGGRKRSILAMGQETELPTILEATPGAIPQTEAKSKLLSRSVLIDKQNLEKLKRYQAELSQASAKELGSQRSASRGKERQVRRFQTPINKVQRDELPKSRLSEYSSASGLIRNQDIRMQQGLKIKIAYEWRNIQRQLQLQDVEGDGKVNKKIFERVIHETRTFLSREELVYLYRKYSDPLNDELLDYNRLSRDLTLSHPPTNLLDPSHLRKSSQDYVGQPQPKQGHLHKRALTSLGGMGPLAKSHAQKFFTRIANTEDEITRQLQKHIAEIKKDIKEADKDKTGTMKEAEFVQILNRYGIKQEKIEKRFIKEGGAEGGDRVDYLKYLKYYL